ncbi:hypothetical protein TNCV_1956221 [Trichonephila clavipes]|nr:hypothetical protein TNCV_1956221 [Trichonephila clavipes]
MAILSSNFNATPTEGRLSLYRFNVHHSPQHGESSAVIKLIPRWLRVRYLHHFATMATKQFETIGDGPCNLEPRSSDEGDTCELVPSSPNYRTVPSEYLKSQQI